MTRELILNAFLIARFWHKPEPGVIHHSDRGSQYCSHEYQKLLANYGTVPSMTRKGNCRDNVVMESFFNRLKNEHVFHRRYAIRKETKRDFFDYIEIFYNQKRRHFA